MNLRKIAGTLAISGLLSMMYFSMLPFEDSASRFCGKFVQTDQKDSHSAEHVDDSGGFNGFLDEASATANADIEVSVILNFLPVYKLLSPVVACCSIEIPPGQLLTGFYNIDITPS